MLETHLGAPRLDCCHRAIRLDNRGRKHHADIACILDDVRACASHSGAHIRPAPESAITAEQRWTFLASGDYIIWANYPVSGMSSLPPLECLRFFEVAARRESFVRAARELDVTSAAVAYRVKMLEDHIGHPLFDRVHRGVVLNPRGKACLADVQRILSDIGKSMDRCRSDAQARRLSIAVVESVADRWLMPRLPGFKANQPDVVIELETDILRVDPQRNDYDLWIVWAGETITLNANHETLFEDTMFPVCSPALLETLGRPRDLVDLHSWPLLYHLGWPSDWSYWFATHGAPSPDLSRASGFRLCSTLVRAAIGGMGAIVGRRTAIADELRQGTLVPLFDHHNEANTSLWLISNPTARGKPEVRAFRKWIIQQATDERDAVGFPLRRPAVSSVRIA